tara:strand:- start:20065 stop:22440 length:2376 start_codon:yes stop_codon:yes gene_type:complete
MEMVELGRQRYWSKVNKAKEMGLQTTVPSGQRLLSESSLKMSESLDNWLKTAALQPGRSHRALPYLKSLPSKVTSAISCKVILDSISQHKTLVSTAMAVSRYLEDEIRYRDLKENNPAMWKHMQRVLDKFTSYFNKRKFIRRTAKKNDVILSSWAKTDALKVGIVCVELFKQSTGIIDIVTKRPSKGRATTMVLPTEDLLEWIKKSDEFSELMSPVFLPTVEPPSDWADPYLGGYSSKEMHRRPLIKANSKSYYKEVENAPMDNVYRAVNAIQRTSFRINPDVYKVMDYCWKKSISLGGLPSMADDLPPTKPIDIDDNLEARKEWRRLAAKIKFDNERQASKRLQLSKVLWVAHKFRNEKIYYPSFLDFRARLYPTPFFLTPQGPQWAKSLLTFGETKPITTEDGTAWLAIHVANCWGMTKNSYEERINWVWNNQDMIECIAKDPKGFTEWANADEPWQFLAACFEWSKFKEYGMGYESSLPISQDATTQGLQLFSLLLRDPVAAYATNCVKRERPGDVYSDVADSVVDKLKRSDHPYARTWLEFGVTRAACKRSTMTTVYSSTFFACKQYTHEWFYDKLKKEKNNVNPFGEETYKPCNWLASIIWDSIGEVVESARKGMDWLQDCVSICCDHNTAIRWVTPNGFIVKMDYEKTSARVIKTAIGQVVRQHSLRFGNGKVNKRKNLNGIAPNYIHSLDGIGGLLGSTVLLAIENGIDSISTVHDSYSTHAENCSTLATCIRSASVNLFKEDLLENFRQQLQTQLPPDIILPETPEYGDLQIESLMDSDYYFS